MANVGYATLQIIPSARGFGTALNGQVAPGLTTAGASGGKKFGAGFLGSVKSIAGPLAAVAGTAAVGNFFKGAITGASDLNETLSKTKVIFGDATKAVVAFADDSSKNILLTKQEALDAAATFGVFGKSAGLTGKDLGGFSTQLTGLASDLSSFYNTSTDEAVTALGAALRGESEPIRRYGVLLDDASLRAEALRMGLIKSTKTALTPQNKVLAAQALILKQTKDAQGDAARTAGGFANQTRILNKNFVDIRNEVGSALLPIITKLTTLIASNLKPAFEGIKTVAKPIIDFFKGLGGEAGKTSATAKQFQGVIQAISNTFKEILPVILDTGRQIGALLGPAFKSIGDIVTNSVLPAIQAFLPAVAPIAKFFYKVFGVTIVSVLNIVVGVVKGVLKVIAGVFNVFAGLFTGDWSRLWKGVKEIFGGIWEAIKGAFKAAINSIKGAFSILGPALLGILKTALELLWNATKAGLGLLVDIFIKLPITILKTLASLPKKLFDFGVNMIEGFIKGIKSMAGSIVSAISSSITDKIPQFVKDKLGIQSPSKVFAEIGRDVGLGFIKGVQGTKDQIRSTFAKLAEDIKKTGSKKLIEAVADAQKKILDLATKRDVLTDRFKEAKANLEDLRNTARDYAKSVSEAVVATGNIAENNSFDAIVRNLTASVTKATAFAAVINDLKNAGLNNTNLQQLIEAGPGSGLAAAQALLSSGKAGIASINELQSELKKQGDAIGKTISGAVYDAAIADAQDAVTTIGKDLTKIEKSIVGVAAALAKEIAKIGKIDSPAWLKDLVGFTKNTAGAATAPKSPQIGGSTSARDGYTANGASRTVVVNNYNPVAEKTSVTVSNTLTRLALIGAYDR